MPSRILLTGSHGLVGTALSAELRSAGHEVVPLDLRAHGPARGDVRVPEDLRRASAGCTGIVHLAAVSRVVWGEHDPELCWSTNVDGTMAVVERALAHRPHPWLIFASSREVYGQPPRLPVNESCERNPVNVYGRAKLAAEHIIEGSRREGLRAAVLRLSNVYGVTTDHATRVVPAFARAAAHGTPLSVQGSDHTFDFTHLDDTVRGIARLVGRLEHGAPPPPPIHLLTGRPTTLGELASLAVELAGTHALIRCDPPRTFDVSHFHGDPSRARVRLGWVPRVTIQAGLRRLVHDFERARAAASPETSPP
jgi:UDP-glucose 4-epimerase